ncbi:hypothetical protein, partial [Kineococcus sp. G2]|uniref:hypothetical protein n=1 Tax=Kineococcus sp. G2 TaxID=3127484 RepID=UPI00301D436A
MTGRVEAGPSREHEAFCELLGADPEWVRAEFEALVAAVWRGGGAQEADSGVDAPRPGAGRPVPRTRRPAPLRR